MKKLMLAAAIVCAAVAAQADPMWREIHNVYKPGTQDGFSGVGYCIYSDTLSQSDAVAAFYSAGESTTFASSAAFSTQYLFSGNWQGYDDVDDVSGAAMYVLCFDQDNNSMYVSPVANGQWDGGEECYTYNIDAGDTSSTAAMSASSGFTTAGWYTVASNVPEPTSGLLMLLGVAGLALKRKRA